jgi:hypothetical protein
MPGTKLAEFVKLLIFMLLFNSARGWQYRPNDYPVDGLNNLLYNVKRIETKLLYTKLLISLPPTPKDIVEAYHISRTFVDPVVSISH